MKIREYSVQIQNLIREVVMTINSSIETIPQPILPPDGVDADFAFPCFPFARTLRMAPAKIAQDIAGKLNKPDWLESVDVVGPYINFTLNKASLFSSVISEPLTDGQRFGQVDRPDPRKILVEYSSPNTNKPLHLGHVRNNVLGMAIVNLLKATGHKVIPGSIMNDRGIHICKAMVAYKHFANGKTPQSEHVKGDHFVGEMYVKFDQELKSNPDLLKEAHEELRKWEQGDPKTLELWETMNSWVYEGFEKTYSRLGSEFDLIQYESKTYLHGKRIIGQGLEQGVFQKREDGSIGVDLTEYKLDEKALLRQDGTSLYVTQDLGVAVERFESMNIDEAVYVVGSEQIYHFKVLFQIFKILGYDWADNCKHLSYGMVYLPDGKMKSREGKVVDADDLMDRMKNLSLQVMEESHFEIDVARRETIAEAIGLGAIKYYILKFNPQKDIHFDPAKSLSFEGSTGAYIQYCHARISSVIKRSGFVVTPDVDVTILGTKEELGLARIVMQFPDLLQNAAEELNPSRLATYLWDIAKSFNVFYAKNRILDDSNVDLMHARLALAAATATVICSGLSILGIEPVEEM